MEFNLVWQFISFFGDIAYWLGFSFSFCWIFPLLKEREREKFKWVLNLLIPAIIFSYFIVFLSKNYFKIPRPCLAEVFCPETYSFPSGHTAVIFTFATITFLKFRKKLYLLFYILAILVALSRIFLQLHTFYDVFAGALFGIVFSFIFFTFHKKFLKKIKFENYDLRKIVHFSVVFVFILLEFFQKFFVQIVLATILLIFILSEILRLKRIYFPFIQEITLSCAFKDELRWIVLPPIYFLLSLIVLLFLPSNYFFAGGIPLIVGDAASGFIGKNFGKRKIFYNKKKTVEGSIAFFITSFLAYLIFFDIKVSLLLTLFSAFVESFVNRGENMILPLSTAAFYHLILQFTYRV